MHKNTTDNEDPNSLTVVDNRTGKSYTIPINNGHFVNASHFRQIIGPEDKESDSDGACGDPSPAEGLQIYDPAFMNTAVVKSAISFVDGEQGILLYRGYRIEELIENSNYLEVSYLLIYGELPNLAQLKEWSHQIMNHTMVHVRLNDLMKSFNYDAHPMGMFISTIAAMSTFHIEANPTLSNNADLFIDEPKLLNKQIKRIIGKATTIASNAYRHRIGREFNLPKNQFNYTENFLYMLDCLDDPAYRPHPFLVEALDKLFIIHAEHEMNCSTAAMRHIASTRVDPFSAVAGAASALYGPMHGGANEAVVRMLQDIGSKDNVPEFIERVKAKKIKLMGFGHRIYKNYDPRVKIVRSILQRVFEVCGSEPLLEVAIALEEAAVSDPYFIERKLYPNVDFYTGLIYKAMGFPTDFFPVLFAIPRISGWLAHWREQLQDKDEPVRIWRPRQIYNGHSPRRYVPIELRTAFGEDPTASDRKAFYKRYFVSVSNND